jgi:hypothetical protein
MADFFLSPKDPDWPWSLSYLTVLDGLSEGKVVEA